MMADDGTFRVLQGTQHSVPGGMLGLLRVMVVDGRVAVRVGIANPYGRQVETLAVGESAEFDDGRLTVHDVHLGSGDHRSQALLSFEPFEPLD
jgi:ferric-dicitrate binding protein FerR (iron transport regulator)